MYILQSNKLAKIGASSFLALCLLLPLNFMAQKTNDVSNKALVQLFREWRAFEVPPLREGVPDYSQQTFDQRQPAYTTLRNRLESLPKENWSVEAQVDWQLLWAEMNGYQFNYQVLKPWQRDPAFYKSIWAYKSDVPAHEGPTSHFVIELWHYTFPLNKEERKKLISDLQRIPDFNQQAQKNLTGNAKDLWIAGIRDIENQSQLLSAILLKPGVAKDKKLVLQINAAKASTDAFIVWLKKKLLKKAVLPG
jgi:hypothetical protein